MNGLSNTCLHRHWALEKVSDKIDVVNSSGHGSLWFRIAYHLFQYHIPVNLPDEAKANYKIKEFVDKNQYDIVWIDKGITIYPSTLKYIKEKQQHAQIVSYSPDNMALRHNQSRQYLKCLPFYDCVVTNKSYIIDDLKSLGAKNVLFVNNTFEPRFHHPYDLSKVETERLGGDVGFIGTWEKERCDIIRFLADNGINVRVWGSGKWNEYKWSSPNLEIMGDGLFSEDYSKAFKALKINLCFLRKMNYDQQTTRSVEIPACGGFMMAERTDEHKSLFEENKEAVYFGSKEELLEKCRYYLQHNEERNKIAEAGYLRCVNDDYSNEGMVRNIIEHLN